MKTCDLEKMLSQHRQWLEGQGGELANLISREGNRDE